MSPLPSSAGSSTNASLSAQFSLTDGVRTIYPAGEVQSAGTSDQETATEGYSETESRGTASTRSWSRSQAIKPVRQWRHTAYHSVDELFHLAVQKIRGLPDQTAIVKRRGHQTIVVKTILVRPMLRLPRMAERFRRSVAAKSAFVADSGAARAAVDARLGEVRKGNGERDTSFWNEE
jgi:hypothetical protein